MCDHLLQSSLLPRVTKLPRLHLLFIPEIPLTTVTVSIAAITMDMDTSQNWLAFSLANPNSYLLQHFSSATPHHGGVEVSEDGMGPKLEDFLGCGGEPLRYTGGEAETSGIYADSDLKTIAAGFLRGAPAAEQEADAGKAVAPSAEARKTVDTFGQRTSIYRGVTRHRWTGRYEAHLWDNSCRREGQSRKGRQVYLGGYDKEEKAARAYDLAALKYWGPTTTTNFQVSNYEKELEEMKNMTRQEFVASLRRKSSGFSRGASIYRGVTRHHQHGRWQARIGRVAGNKDLYLGTFSTQEEAAEAYDIAAIKFRGLNAVTNFDMSRYDVKSIANSSLPIGGMSGRTSKASENSSCSSSDTMSHRIDGQDSSSFGFSVLPINKPDQDYWSLLALHQQQQQQSNHQTLGFGLFSSGVNMDFSNNAAAVAASNGSVMSQQGLVWCNGVLQQEQQQEQSQSNSSGSSSIPYATPISGFGGSYEGQGYSNMGSWVTPAASATNYYHQAAAAAKPNVAFFQTPIFGME